MRLELRIHKRTQQEWLMWGMMVLPFCFGGLLELLGMPNAVKYLLDIAWAGLLVLLQLNRRVLQRRGNIGVKWILAYLIYTISVYLFNFQSIFYYLWGFRNNFRFYVAFFAFASFFSHDTCWEYLKLFDVLFWINFIITMIQYLFMGLSSDNLGGLFGTLVGVNMSTNLFIVIVVCKSILMYIHKKETLTKCILVFVAAAVTAALAEIKFFFVEAVIIVAVTMLITNFSWRKLGTMLLGGICIVGGAYILTYVFNSGDLNFMSFSNLWSMGTSASGYTSSGDLNRVTAIFQINDFLLENWKERFFGLGLGNCDVSSFAICNTPFYQRYADLHYTWFSLPFVYLEMGYGGLVFFFGFFVLCFTQARKRMEAGTGDVIFCQLGMLVSVLCCLIAVYNSSLRNEIGYLAYFVLALPFIDAPQEAALLRKNVTHA